MASANYLTCRQGKRKYKLVVCACNCMATGLYRGSGYNGYRAIAIHRWLCDQCRDNIIDDGGRLRAVKHQKPPQWAVEQYEQWYTEFGE